MKVLIFFQEPDFEVENYVKREYVLLEGVFNSEKDIISTFMEHYGMDTEFWYKLKLIPVNVIPIMYECLRLDPKETYYAYILDRSNRTTHVKQMLYRLKEMKKLKEYVTKKGEVIPIPEHIETIPVNEQTVFVKINGASVEDAISFISHLQEMTGLKLYYVSNEVEFIRVEEVEEINFAD